MGKMSGEMAAYFAKKGEKGLAKHEKREAAGKEKDTRKIAKKEERALKGAPKKLREYEKKEHKEMGYAKGGKVKRYAEGGMGGGMPPQSRMNRDAMMAANSRIRSGMPTPGVRGGSAMPRMTPGGMGVGMPIQPRMTPAVMSNSGYAKGGKVKADGTARKGKTRGRII